jgi:hypothetical protein
VKRKGLKKKMMPYNKSLHSDARKSPRAAELKRYMPRTILIAILLLSPKQIIACSCGDYMPLGTVYKKSNIIVHVKIVEVYEKRKMTIDDGSYSMVADSARAEVKEIVKGEKKENTREIEIVESMCPRTIHVSDLEIGHEYVLPLKTNEGFASHTSLAKYSLFSCAHSGGELIRGKIYDHNIIWGDGITLEQFMFYDDFILEYGT